MLWIFIESKYLKNSETKNMYMDCGPNIFRTKIRNIILVIGNSSALVVEKNDFILYQVKS